MLSVRLLMLSVRLLTVAIVVLPLCGSTLSAQKQKNSRALAPARVALVAVDSLPAGNRVSVVRRIHVKPQDVILVSAAAAAVDLAGAIHVFNGLRFRDGDSLTIGLEASPNQYVASPDWPGSPYEAWIQSQLSRLRNARTFQVRGVGINRAVWITLPAPKGSLYLSSPYIKK
jgi:hypothetical protein